MKPETNSDKLLTLLEKKGRASAKDCGADMQTFMVLEKAGAIRRDGKISTGKRGKPPVAWVIADGKEAPVPEVIEKPTAKAPPINVPSELLNRVINEVLSLPHYRNCRCGMFPGMTPKAVRELGQGCTNPHHCCSALVSVRQRAKL